MAAIDDRSPPQSRALAALYARGFIEQASDVQAVDEVLAQGPVTFYCGFDPTAVSMHAGNLVPIMAMRLLQKHGHRPIVLLGGGTARVGDPSGRNETRKMLDEAALRSNVEGIRRQFGRFLAYDDARGPGSAALCLDNESWLGQWKYIDFLREIGVHFTVNRMIAAKTYRDRLDNELPLSFLEFNYQLLQAYDFLHLYRQENCVLQLGGNDQWGNMIAGVELVRRIVGKEQGPAHCLTFPLLTTADGRKMGKSQKGSVWLDPELLSPFDYYQYWISCDDRDVRKLMLLFTDLPVEEVETLCQAEGAALRDVKTRLAYEATRIAHGDDAADKARVAAVQAFGGSEDWSAVPAVHVAEATVRLIDLVVDERLKAFDSKRSARQRIEGGAVRIDGEVVKDPNLELTGEAYPGGLRLQAGKKTRFRILFGAPS